MTHVSGTVKLEWEDLGGDYWRAKAPLFGNLRVEKSSDKFISVWSVPGYCNTFVEGRWDTAEEAKSATQSAADARISSAVEQTGISDATRDALCRLLAEVQYEGGFRDRDIEPTVDHIIAALTAKDEPSQTEPVTAVKCEACQGNGEIVTDWDRYLHGEPGDVGDEGTADCPDCDGIGTVATLTQRQTAEPVPGALHSILEVVAHVTGDTPVSITVATRKGGKISIVDPRLNMNLLRSLSISHPQTVTDAAVRLPKLTKAMIRAACMAHYGSDDIIMVDMTSDDINYTFEQAFRRMWKGIDAALSGGE